MIIPNLTITNLWISLNICHLHWSPFSCHIQLILLAITSLYPKAWFIGKRWGSANQHSYGSPGQFIEYLQKWWFSIAISNYIKFPGQIHPYSSKTSPICCYILIQYMDYIIIHYISILPSFYHYVLVKSSLQSKFSKVVRKMFVKIHGELIDIP